jgi:HK97 family phage prohead protease
VPLDDDVVEEFLDSGVHVRQFSTDLEVRESRKGRIVRGIAVPWDVEAEIDEWLIEGFRRGAFDHQFGSEFRVAFGRNHINLGGTLIGRGQEFRNDAKGLYVEMLTSRTPVGEETVELVRDRALRYMSVAFQPRLNKPAPSQLVANRTAIWRTKGDIREVAMVLEGAYGDLAEALGVRHKADADTPRPGLVEAQRALDELRPLPAPPAAY